MNVRRLAAVAAAGVIGLIGPLAVQPATADAAAPAASRISAHPSDTTPGSGEQFVVRGVFTLNGERADHRIVKIQTVRNGHWVQISGARVSTDSTGHYRCRLILSQTGERFLRAVGVAGDNGRNTYRQFQVTVH